MRFLSFVRTAENQGSPPQALIDAMGPFMAPFFEAGTLIDAGGLAPALTSTRARLSGGHITVLDGPFSESKEMIGSYAILECSSQEEAVEVLRQFLELHRTHWPGWEGECEIRRIFGAND